MTRSAGRGSRAVQAGLFGAVASMVSALFLGFDPLASIDRPGLVTTMLLAAGTGFAAGLLLAVFGPALLAFVRRSGLRGASIDLPVVGRLDIGLAEAQAEAAWNMHIEMTTRIVTRSLYLADEGGVLHPTGRIDAALASLYSLFGIVRDEMKKAGPTPPDAIKDGQPSLETLAHRLLNDELRPCLARWHPLRDAWERTDAPESEWPLATLCRRDLEAVRLRALDYAIGFGQIAGADDTLLDALKRDYATGTARWHSTGDGDPSTPPSLAPHARIGEAVERLPADARP